MNDTIESPIVKDREIMSGTPVFAGTRVPIHTLFDYLRQGTIEDYLDEFPSVSLDQALRVLELAEGSLLGETA